MHFECTVYQPMYEHNGKQYIRVTLSDSTALVVARSHEKKSHLLRTTRVEHPLIGRVLTLKVPYRYRRVMCEIRGDKPVQALTQGDSVTIDSEFTPWNAGEHCGFSWKINKIST